MIDDSQLIEQTLSGDRAAFNDLVIRYQDRLFASMWGSPVHRRGRRCRPGRVCKSLCEARQFSAIQPVLYLAVPDRVQHSVEPTSPPTQRVSLDQVRETTGLEPVDHVDSPEEPMLRRERVAMVRQAMEMLSEEHRSILVLREMDDYPYETIAEILEISIGTVRSRLSRARYQLKLALESLQES